ncbi:sensor histidine kinase [Rubrivirga marina]|uniref:histidine kinase n=1 Tax=Rubrivirga marina TaxID=1196024 RepID=A0A271J0A7_9BACT|nr:sensor histidine kinase [Rubrivirga marina]PAP76790.1 hypothetical protein BSZ37_10260 [Rubrivirga marina]
MPSLLRRLRSAFAVHPNGPTPVTDAVAGDLAALSRRRARVVAWVGVVSAFPALYIDHWVPYEAGLWAEDPTYHVGILVWRFATIVTLGAFLWIDRRTPAGRAPDTRLASGFGVLGIALTAWFGVWFVQNGPSYPMFSFLLLMLAFLLHPPSRWMVGAYALAAPAALAGALVHGTPPPVVVEWVAPYVLTVVLVIMVDRVLYRRVYQGFESERRLGRANAELQATLQTLHETQARLVEAERQAERTRISRDLHDSVGAQLSSLLAGVELAKLARRSSDDDAPPVTLEEVEADAREALQQLRETVWALHTAEITVEGLAAQLRRFAEARARRAGMHAAVHAEGDRYAALPAAHALQLYRIGQEAVQNAVKHSGGTAVSVRVVVCGGRVDLVVTDDGTFRTPVPVAGDGAPSGFGMSTMRDRAAGLGGSLDLDTEAGTTVTASVPLDPEPVG